MSSGDGGGKVFGSLKSETLTGGGNFFENLFTDIANYGLQTVTGGVAGYGKDGVKGGVSMGAVKEVTGANAAEEANEMAKKQLEQQEDAANAARVESQSQVERSQIQQSRMAGAARNAGRSSSTAKGKAVGSFSLGADEKDFLGL